MKIRVILLVSMCLMHLNALAQKPPIKVACIGNSVTYGYLLKDAGKEAYSAVLQNLLGNKYSVRNFGFSGATLLRKGHKPYFKTEQFNQALSFKPDIAIIHLGLNDTDPRNWPEFLDEFESDYAWLIDSLRMQNPKLKTYICQLTPIFSEHPRFKSGTRDWYWQIQEALPQIANANNTELIDLHTPLYNRPDLFPDNLHPDREGATIIAKTVYSALTGNYAGLKVSEIFADHMVLQRNKPIPIYGTANADEVVKVTFNGKTMQTSANRNGKWKVWFPAMKEGGPHQIDISSKDTKIAVKDVLLGDVWLCSGQSNMVFSLNSAATGREELKNLKANSKLRILQFNVNAETNNAAWDSTTLEKVNKLQLFNGHWKAANAESLASFSAVGYYFGKRLVQDVNVPIGLMQMAVGGSIIESWIDRFTMEHDEQLVDVLTNWRHSDFIQPWARERADVNLKNAMKVKQRHPYEPVYNYEAGIAKLIESPIKGVIWYQGESNAQNAEQYKHSFPVLVDSWRKRWGYDFPFYYVQLSSLNRPSWPYFRDVQRQLQSVVSKIWMAVSSDLGDSLDVHPIRKKEVGERLALLALKNSYGKAIRAEGPVPVSARIDRGSVVVLFKEATKLLGKDSRALTGFELLNEKGNRILPEKTTVFDKEIWLKIPRGQHIKKVQYSWQPFSRANLMNEAGLPASTFSLSIN